VVLEFIAHRLLHTARADYRLLAAEMTLAR
jgi:hypothetical protein